MSYDLNVHCSCPTVDELEGWRNVIAKARVEVRFHPDFRPETHSRWLPVKLTVGEDCPLPGAAALKRLGTILTGFNFSHYPPFEEDPDSFDYVGFGCPYAVEETAAALLCAAGLAVFRQAPLVDPQRRSIAFSGGSVVEVLTAFGADMDGGFVLEAPAKPERFDGWA